MVLIVASPLLTLNDGAEHKTDHEEKLYEEQEKDLPAHLFAEVSAQNHDQVGLSRNQKRCHDAYSRSPVRDAPDAHCQERLKR